MREGRNVGSIVEAAVLASLFLSVFARFADGRPNVLFILADDLGWGDVGFRSDDIRTPHIDRLASSGRVLEEHYVQAICSPTRAALMTGRYPMHNSINDWIKPKARQGLPLNETTIAQKFKEAGYATYCVGKWHLGLYKWAYTPTFRGFDQFYGFYGAAEDYFSHKVDGSMYDMHYDSRPNCGEGCSQTAMCANGVYSTVLFTEKSVDIIEKHRSLTTNKPFFFYLAYQAVHSPIGVLREDVSPYARTIRDKKRRIFAGMVSSLDSGIGNVTAALKRNGYLDNTLIIFSADNGGPTVSTDGIGSRNWPLRGGKHSLYEGGTRAVAFITGYGIHKRKPYGHMIHIVDWFSTLADVAGYSLTGTLPLDSVSHWRYLSSKPGVSEGRARSSVVYGIVPSPSGPGTGPKEKGFGVRVDIAQRKYKLLLNNGGIPASWCNSSSSKPSCAFVDRAIEECPNRTCLFRLDQDDREIEEVSNLQQHKLIVNRLRPWAEKLMARVRLQKTDFSCREMPGNLKVLKPWCNDIQHDRIVLVDGAAQQV